MDGFDEGAFLREWGRHLRTFNRLLEGESPRGAAVLARAYLESALQELLLVYALRNPDSEHIRGIGRAVAGMLGEKIKMARKIDLLGQDVCDSADDIREIGNRFAHRPGARSFDDADVRQFLIALARRDGHRAEVEDLKSGGLIEPLFGVAVLQEAMNACIAAIVGAHQDVQPPDETSVDHD